MIAAIAGLAWHRLRGRAAATVLLAAAAAAASGLTVTIAGLGASSTAQAVDLALARLPDDARALRVTAFPTSGDTAVALENAASAGLALASDFASEPVRGLTFRRSHDPNVVYDLQLTAVDDVSRWVSLTDGRQPQPCDGQRCEAVLLSMAEAPADLPATLHLAGLTIDIVGRGLLTSSLPLGSPDQRGARTSDADPYARISDPPPALLVVDGVTAAAGAPGAVAVGRTMLWTAPLDVSSVRPWTVAPFVSALARARTSLDLAALGLELSAPTATIDEALTRAAANGGRLWLVTSLAAAILIAFAAATAILGRRDIGNELERLAAAGAGRRATWLLVVLEAALPVVPGVALGWLAGIAVTGAWATASGADAGPIIEHSLVTPAVAGGILAIAGATVAAVAVASVLVLRRDAIAGLVPGLALAGLLVVWRLLAGETLGVAGLSSALNAPLIALLPAAVGLAVAGLFLVVMPRLLRGLAVRSGNWPIVARLAIVSAARDAARPVATLAVLTFALGGLLFAAAESATLHRGAADEAAFETAMDLRVVEAGTDLTLDNTDVPLDRYTALGSGITTVPVAIVNAAALPGGPVTLVGLPPDALPHLAAWRSDFSAATPAAIAAAIAVPGSFAGDGHRLSADDPNLTFRVTVDGDPVRLSAVVATGRGDAATIVLGQFREGTSSVSAALPAGAIGGTVIGILVNEGRLVAGENHPGLGSRATLTFEGLDGLVDATPVLVEMSGPAASVIRPALPTDGLVLPALASSGLGAEATAAGAGTIAVTFGDRPALEVKVVETADRFPALGDPNGRFIVVDLAPLLVALDGVAPGSGHPNEAWLTAADPATLERVQRELGGEPFRATFVRSRADLAAASLADPFAGAFLAALMAAAIVGLILALLGVVISIRADAADATGELRDLSALGLPEPSLRAIVAGRALVLAFAGVTSGLILGAVLVILGTAATGLAADVRPPVPPLVIEWPLDVIVIAVAAPLSAILVSVALLGRRTRQTGRGPA